MFDHNYGPSTPTFKARSAAPDWADMSGRDHFVQIYTDDGHIMEAVSGYFLNGLRFNEACVMIGTGDHNREVERLVRAGGADVDAAISEGTFVILDACETLAAFMADGMPRKDLFDAAVGPIVRKAAETRTHVRAFGEMVAVLAGEGNAKAAVELERLWNGLAKDHAFRLFCAYPQQTLTGLDAATHFDNICSAHTHVIGSALAA